MLNSPNTKPRTKIIWRGFLWRLFFLFLLLGALLLGWLFFSLNKNLNKSIIPDNTTPGDTHQEAVVKNNSSNKNLSAQLKGKENNRINILLLGIGGEQHSGKYLTDTIALLSINPKTYQSAILSIPRDLYVQIPGTRYKTKINALYTYGLKNKELSDTQAVSLIRSSVEKITGEPIPYYVILDFAGFKEIIKTIDGINVEVEDDINDPHYPGPNFSYETFTLSKGFHHLDADTALKYARVRHTKGGDFGRTHRQQQIISATREKALSLKILSNPFKIIELMNTLGNHLKTNITKREIPAMINLIRNVNIHQATTKVLDAWSNNSLLKSKHVPLGGIWAYVLVPKSKGYGQIQSLAHNIFNLKILEENKAKIKEENAQIGLATENPHSFTLFKKILQDWDYRNIQNVSNIYATKCPQNSDAILSYSSREKLFTLNDLAEKLDTTITYDYGKQNTPSQKKHPSKHPDIILCLTEETISFFNDESNPTDKEISSTNPTVLNTEGKVMLGQ